MKSLATRSRYRNSLSWILTVALLFALLLPVHFHLHHVDTDVADANAVAHVTDIHVHHDSQAAKHHSDAHTLTPSTDISLKQPNTVQPPLLAVLLIVLLFITLNPHSLLTNWCSSRVQHYFNQHRNTPPLRAPPHA